MAKTSESRWFENVSVFMPRAITRPPEYAAASAAFCKRILPLASRPAFITIPRIITSIKRVMTETMLIVPPWSACRFLRRRQRVVSGRWPVANGVALLSWDNAVKGVAGAPFLPASAAGR